MQEKPRQGFSQRHPFLFGLLLICAAVVLIAGTMAVLRLWLFPGDDRSGPFASSGDRLGLVHVQGMILDARETVDFMRKLREDGSVKGVVLRIDSPGGVVAPSQEIYTAVRKLAGTKPVVVSMGATAASGGYYVAAAADHILANPGTLTGSIGVRLEFANLQELADKLGISYEIFESGQFKTAGSPFRELSAEERAYLQALVDDLHRQFVSDVSKGRGMSIGEVERWADGRALTGSQALDAGLVDELGGLEEAFSRVKSLAGVSGKLPLWEGPPEERNWIRELLSASMNELAESFVAALAEKSAPRFAAR